MITELYIENLIKEGKLHEAIDALTTALKSDKKGVWYYWRGVAYYKLQDLSQAKNNFYICLQLLPDCAKAKEYWETCAEILGYESVGYVDI